MDIQNSDFDSADDYNKPGIANYNARMFWMY